MKCYLPWPAFEIDPLNKRTWPSGEVVGCQIAAREAIVKLLVQDDQPASNKCLVQTGALAAGLPFTDSSARITVPSMLPCVPGPSFNERSKLGSMGDET